MTVRPQRASLTPLFESFTRCQKRYTTDYLTKTKKKNHGEVPRYYVEHSHEPIIDPIEWDAVQDEIERRRTLGRSYRSSSVLCTKLKCGDCGGWYGAKVWHSADKYRTRVWQCNCKFDDGKARCTTPAFREDEIQARFLKAYNSVITNKAQYIKTCRIMKEALTDTAEIDAEMEDLKRQMEVVEGLSRTYLQSSTSSAQDPAAFRAKYNAYVEQHQALEERFAELTAQRAERLKKAKEINRFTETLRKRDELLTEFDSVLWLTVVQDATVHSDGSITFRFFSGKEITV